MPFSFFLILSFFFFFPSPPHWISSSSPHRRPLHKHKTHNTTHATHRENSESICMSLNVALSPPSKPDGHVLPINCLVAGANDILYSAGRDGSIVAHAINGPATANHKHSDHIQLHSDWINGLAVIPSTSQRDGVSDMIVSGSSDMTVKYWQPATGTHGLLGNHTDFVKGVTHLKKSSRVYSAGLDGTVQCYDINRPGVVVSSWKNEGPKNSLYSIASNSSSVFAGDMVGRLCVLDVRSGDSIPVSKIRVHDDVIKSLLVNEKYIASGGSDGKVKIFDLRNIGTCVKEYEYDESVWCLLADQKSDDYGFESFYVGGSKGNVYHTSNEVSTKIHKEKKGILSIAAFKDDIFISSMRNSNITNIANPEKSIAGQSGLIRTQILNNKRHVVSLSTCDEVMLWDILSMKLVKSFGRDVEFENIISELQTSEILNSWCSVFVRAGKLFIQLNERCWNDCEVYGSDLNGKYEFSQVLEYDTRYSLGKLFIMSLFHEFIKFQINKDKLLREERIKEIKTAPKLSIRTKPKNSETLNNSLKTSTPIDEAPNSSIESPSNSKFRFFSRKKSLAQATATSGTSQIAIPQTPEVFQPPPEDYSNKAYRIIQENKQHYSQLQSSSTLQTISVLSTPTDPHLTQIQSLSPLQKEQIQVILSKVVRDRDSVGYIDTYAEDLNKLLPNMTITNNVLNSVNERDKEFIDIEKRIPLWLGEFLLKNVYTNKDTPKVSFLVVKDLKDDTVPELKRTVNPPPSPPTVNGNGANSNGSSRNNSSASDPLPTDGETKATTAPPPQDPYLTEMKLNAYGMLRIRKVLQYIYDKMDIERFVAKAGPSSYDLSLENLEDWLELTCDGEVLSNDQTLVTLRAFGWKKSTDLRLEYRRKKEKPSISEEKTQ